MQECFREHPDIYGEELRGDDEEGEGAPSSEDGAAPEGDAAVAKGSQQATAEVEKKQGAVSAAVTEVKTKTEEKAAEQ
jgi:hypothetical protein